MKTRLVALTLVIAVLLTAALTAAWERRDLTAGEARLRLHAGASVAVADDGGPFFPVTDDRRLGENDRVYVVEGGATLEMARDVEIELRTGSDVTVDRVPVLRAGDALVRTNRAPMRVKAVSDSSSTVAPDSAVRLSRTLAFGAAVYRGHTVVESAGQRLDVAALRQASVSGVGVLPREPSPILVDSGDEWDRHYLGFAIELTRQLDALSQGFSANAVTSARPLAELVREAIPSAAPLSRLGSALASHRRPGELLVGTVIATAAAAPFAPVFDFRDRGATWGLVVLDQDITDADALFRLLRLVLDDAPIVATTIAAPAATTTTVPATPDTVPSPEAPAPADARQPGDDPEAPAPPRDPIEEIVDDVGDVTDDVDDEIGDIVAETVEPVLDEVGDTTSDLADDPIAPAGSLLGR